MCCNTEYVSHLWRPSMANNVVTGSQLDLLFPAPCKDKASIRISK